MWLTLCIGCFRPGTNILRLLASLRENFGGQLMTSINIWQTLEVIWWLWGNLFEFEGPFRNLCTGYFGLGLCPPGTNLQRLWGLWGNLLEFELPFKLSDGHLRDSEEICWNFRNYLGHLRYFEEPSGTFGQDSSDWGCAPVKIFRLLESLRHFW